MRVRVFDCPTLGRQDWGPKCPVDGSPWPPVKKVAGVLCGCGLTHLASEVNLRDEEVPDDDV